MAAGAPGARDKYAVLFDQASDAILSVLPDGTIDAANQALEEMTGYLKAELLGRSAELLVPPSSAPSGPRLAPVASVAPIEREG